jgi:hypothetical protein
VKLQQQLWDRTHGGAHLVGLRVDEQPDRHHERRQPRGELGGAFDRDVARALLVQHEAHRIGARGDRSVDIGLSGQAADLDAGTFVHHGNQSSSAGAFGTAKAGS